MTVTANPCPRCGRATPHGNNPDRPFCSARCRLLDLGAWVSGEHAIAGEPAALEEEHLGPHAPHGPH